MSKIFFGKSFNLSFTPQRDGDSVAAHSIVAARVYQEKPSDTVIDNDSDTGFIEKVTSWTDGTADNEQLIAFSALDDVEGDDEDYELRYFVISYRLEDAEQIQRNLITRQVWRSRGQINTFGVTSTEVYQLNRKLEQFYDATGIADKIELAEIEVKIDLQSQGFDLDRTDFADAKELVRYKAAQLASEELIDDLGGPWERTADRLKDVYAALTKKVQIGIGLTEESAPEQEARVHTGSIFVMR